MVLTEKEQRGAQHVPPREESLAQHVLDLSAVHSIHRSVAKPVDGRCSTTRSNEERFQEESPEDAAQLCRAGAEL
jgi:hypothetical protein